MHEGTLHPTQATQTMLFANFVALHFEEPALGGAKHAGFRTRRSPLRIARSIESNRLSVQAWQK